MKVVFSNPESSMHRGQRRPIRELEYQKYPVPACPSHTPHRTLFKALWPGLCVCGTRTRTAIRFHRGGRRWDGSFFSANVMYTHDFLEIWAPALPAGCPHRCTCHTSLTPKTRAVKAWRAGRGHSCSHALQRDCTGHGCREPGHIFPLSVPLHLRSPVPRLANPMSSRMQTLRFPVNVSNVLIFPPQTSSHFQLPAQTPSLFYVVFHSACSLPLIRHATCVAK